MTKTNYIYAIVNSDMLKVLQLYSQNVRFNKDKTKFLFKTYKEEPRLINVPFYTKTKIKEILGKEEWK